MFTFRIASDEMKKVSLQLSGLMSQAKAVGGAIDAVQISNDKKRKELRGLDKRIEARKKTLVRLGKRAQKGEWWVMSIEHGPNDP